MLAWRWSFASRNVIGVLSATISAGVLSAFASPALADPDPFAACAGQPAASLVACENSQPGSIPRLWRVSNTGDPSIQGFATSMSVNLGGRIDFKIDTPSTAYHIEIYRLGYYGGLGARLIQGDIQPSVALPQSQPRCLADVRTGLIDCGNWAVSASWSVPADAVSGVYVANLVRDDLPGPSESQIPFVVRNDAGRSDLLVQTSDATWEAYNEYGGNSLYTCTIACPPGKPEAYKAAFAVSYNRPFQTAEIVGGRTYLYSAEYPMIRFLEANGYDVSYVSEPDVARDGALLLNHRAFMSSGHDEYWSQEQRDAVTRARDAGVNIAFFSGNEMFWKTRWQPSMTVTGAPFRTLVSYKETHFNKIVDPADPPIWTGTWADPRFRIQGDPPNALSGQFTNVDAGEGRITVSSQFSKLRFWRNTAVAGLAPGQSLTLAPLTPTIGYEWDVDADNGFRPPGLIDLSQTTVSGLTRFTDYGSLISAPNSSATHSLTLYRARSGALVFATGTIQWSWGLDADNPSLNPPDPTMQQATVNILGDMGLSPRTLLAGLVPASRSTDTVPPRSKIVVPRPRSSVRDGSVLTIRGTATDAGGGVVAGVELSTDGGLTWHKAQGTSSWSYTWIANRSPKTTLLSRAVDDSGNIERPSDATKADVSCPCSLWGGTRPQVPDSGDRSSVEVGVRFTSDVAGTVLGIRFYKAPANRGTHRADLWTSRGKLLAQAVFRGGPASGWQVADFAHPVHIRAHTVYVASTFDPTGHYAFTATWFYPPPSPAPLGGGVVDSPPLHALRNTGRSLNGVFTYTGSPSFPRHSFDAANYWVDVLFVAGR
jgi:hypothetical protein